MLFTFQLASQNAQKAIITCMVYTNIFLISRSMGTQIYSWFIARNQNVTQHHQEVKLVQQRSAADACEEIY